jgi:tRNA (guanine-N(7)-)-methyltransferase
MRMRKKKNLGPRMERCAEVQVFEPETLRGRWAKETGYGEIRAELGCGKGRFTAGTAEQNPDSLLVALEKVPDAMVVGMEHVCEQNLKNVRFLDMDVNRLTEVFAPGEVSVIYINFPDPWPRSREAKRRLTSPLFLELYKTVLAPGGRIEFKTDQAPLFQYSLEQLDLAGFDVIEATGDLHADGPVGVMTDYEAKFYEQGVKINRCVAVKPL